MNDSGNAVRHYLYLHTVPELSGHEKMTSDYVFSSLKKFGYCPVALGHYGVYADLISDPDANWILFRADMDALAINEPLSHDPRSKHDGVMHACGHDAHTSMLLGAAEKLKDRKLPQNIRFLFQPAEENTEGGCQMVKSGCMDKKFIAAFAMHVWPDVVRGTISVKAGAMMASSDVFLITCRGKSVHCAQRQNGADALQTAVRIVSEFPKIEKLAENDGTMLFCGSIHSGTSHNIVPDTATVMGTLRSYSEEHRQSIKSALEKCSEEFGKINNVKIDVSWSGACPVLENDASLVDKLVKLLPSLKLNANPTLASEDFAYYQQECPGVLMWLGAGDVPALHSENFYVPCEIIPQGVETWIKIAENEWR